MSISLNIWDKFETDYVFATRYDAYTAAVNAKRNVITTSSICEEERKNVYVIDYQKWVVVDGEVQDSSGILVMSLLRHCGVSKLVLAGFDGFHVNLNKNYYDKTMGHPVTAEQAEKRNAYFRNYVKNLRREISVIFLTESLYEDKL